MNTYKITDYGARRGERRTFEVQAETCDVAALMVWPEGSSHHRYANTQSPSVSPAARDNCHYQTYAGFRGVWAQNVAGLAEAEAHSGAQAAASAAYFENKS